jgi:hypothetical protein
MIYGFGERSRVLLGPLLLLSMTRHSFHFGDQPISDRKYRENSSQLLLELLSSVNSSCATSTRVTA